MKKFLAGAGALAAFLPMAAFADQPKPWEWRFQAAASPIMEQIEWFERYTLWFIIPITLLVMFLLGYCIWRFRASANPVPSRTSHNTLIEVIWTVGPVVVLLAQAAKSEQVLSAQRSRRAVPSDTRRA